MEIPVKDQLCLLSIWVLAGLGAGGLYDLLSMIKREGRRKRNALCSGVFIITVTAAAFALSMLDVRGQSFVMEAAAICGTFWLYQRFISERE